MRKRTSDYYSSDTEQIASSEGTLGLGGGGMMMMEGDVFVLRPPQCGDHTGEYQEAKRAYDNGPDEVRQLLLHECNLIYECKMCRNMFRSLAQFISHKRVYCCNVIGGGGGASDKDNGSENFNGFTGDQVMMIQPQNDNMAKTMPEGDHHGDIGLNRKKNSDHNHQEKSVVTNDMLPNAETGKLGDTANSKTEWVNNTSVMHNEQHTGGATAVTADEQNINFKEQKGNEAVRVNGHLLCKMCKGVFQTAKQLKQHLQKKHLSSYVFKCPNCTLTFMHPTEVIRHLAVEHKKSAHRIGRESILKARVLSGDEDDQQQQQQKIANNRELKRLQSSPDVVGSMGAGGISSDGTAPKKIISICHYCGKSFERRAALSTHILHCRVKQASREKLFMSTTNGVPSMNKRMKLQANACADNTPVIKTEKTSGDTDLDTEQLNEMFANLGKQTFGTGLRTVSLDQLDLERAPQEEKEKESTKVITESTANYFENQDVILRDTLPPSAMMENIQPAVAVETETVVKAEIPASNAVISEGEVKKRRRFRIVHAEKRLSCRCKICGKQFNALSNLRRHISMFHYRSERFGCTLCDYRAFRRYDIVNHLGYVHKMKGEREAMSTEYVSVHEVNYSKDDVESDIVLLNDEPEAASPTDTPPLRKTKTHEKRVRRRKMISNGDGVVVTGKITRQKLKRSSSLLENGTGKVLQKRPIRNRIKPVNKDFVYDLSNLLKKEGGVTGCGNVGVGEVERTLKRRNTWYNSDAGHDVVNHKEPLITPACLDNIKGAAQRLTLSLVGQGLAASATQPELPSERPQMRPRLISTNRADMQPVPVIEASELEAARLKSTLLEDTFLEKVSKRSAPVFKIKPCLALQHSTLSWLLEKVDSSLHNSAAKKLSNEALTTEQNNQVSPPPSIPRATSPPPTPRKRITLLERLNENKIKYQESLLRSALEN